jgi:hypothetical protein
LKKILIPVILVLVLSAFAPPPIFYYYIPIAFGPNPGSVRGTFLRQVDDQYAPIVGADLYLAKVKWCDDHQCGVAILDLVNSPRTITDSSGGFEFLSADPGDYALVYYKFPATYLISQPTNSAALLLSVESNRLTDLGTMEYSCFPTYCMPISSDGKSNDVVEITLINTST